MLWAIVEMCSLCNFLFIWGGSDGALRKVGWEVMVSYLAWLGRFGEWMGSGGDDGAIRCSRWSLLSCLVLVGLAWFQWSWMVVGRR